MKMKIEAVMNETDKDRDDWLLLDREVNKVLGKNFKVKVVPISEFDEIYVYEMNIQRKEKTQSKKSQ